MLYFTSWSFVLSKDFLYYKFDPIVKGSIALILYNSLSLIWENWRLYFLFVLFQVLCGHKYLFIQCFVSAGFFVGQSLRYFCSHFDCFLSGSMHVPNTSSWCPFSFARNNPNCVKWRMLRAGLGTQNVNCKCEWIWNLSWSLCFHFTESQRWEVAENVLGFDSASWRGMPE